MVELEQTLVQVDKLAELERIPVVEIGKSLEQELDRPEQQKHRLAALEVKHKQQQVVVDTLAAEVAGKLELDSDIEVLAVAIGIAVAASVVAVVAADIAVVVVAVVEVVDYSLVVATGIVAEVPVVVVEQVVKTHKERQQQLELDSLEKQRQQLEDGYEPHGWCRPNFQLEVHFLRTQ